MEIATWCTLGLKMPWAMFRPESLILSPSINKRQAVLRLSGPAKTNQRTVTLSISVTDSSDVAGLYFSRNWNRPTAGQGGWQNYSTSSNQRLISFIHGNSYTFYVWAKDALGNVSARVSFTTEVDTQAPSGLRLSGPAKTNQNSVTLSISVTDSSDVAGFYLSTSNSRPTAGQGGWENYRSSWSYWLSSLTHGSRPTFYIWIKDAVGNISARVSFTTEVDTYVQPPLITGQGSGSNRANYGSSATIAVSRLDSDVTHLFFRLNDASTPGASISGWKTKASSVSINIGANRGRKNIYGWTKDNAGNVSNHDRTWVRRCIFGLCRFLSADDDDAVLSGLRVVADNLTNDATVRLDIAVDQPAAVTGMYLSETNVQPLARQSGWQKYRSSQVFTLTETKTQGPRKLYVWLKDAEGNVVAASDSVIVDTVAPQLRLVADQKTGNRSVEVTARVDQPNEMAALYFSESSTPPKLTAQGWQSYATPKTFALGESRTQGLRNFSVWGKDQAGNLSARVDAVVAVGMGLSQARTQLLGTAAAEEAKGIVFDSAGNFYLAGQSAGDFNQQSNAGGFDLFLIKYDALGQQLWSQLIGDSRHNVLQAMVIDSQDHLYLLSHNSTTLDESARSEDREIVLQKLTSAGNSLWQKSFKSATYEAINALAVDSQDHLYLVGNMRGNFYSSSGHVGTDAFLLKLDAMGTQQWLRLSAEGWETTEGIALAVDSQDNVYLTGSTQSNTVSLTARTNSFASQAPRQQEAYVIKYNALGKRLWARTIGGSGLDVGKAVAVDTDDNLYVAGDTTATLTEEPKQFGWTGCFF